MNSNFGEFNFDLGIGSNNRSSKPLNEQKNQSGGNDTFSFSSTKTMPSWQPAKPAWTHQSAPSQPGMNRTDLGGPVSMVGDIMGKNWNSTALQSGAGGVGIVGIANKNPNLFGDLVNSALGQNSSKGSGNQPLKSVPPVKTSFSMGRTADSLSKTSESSGNSYNSAKTIGGGTWGANQSFPSGGGGNVGGYGSSSMKGTGLGGAPLRNGGGVGGMSSNKDPFGSLLDFSSKPMSGGGAAMGSAGRAPPSGSQDSDFGDFQNASKSNVSNFPSVNSDPFGSNVSSVPIMNSVGAQTAQVPSVQSTGGDSFDMFFPPKTGPGGSKTGLESGAGGQQFSGGDDWGFDSDIGGHDAGGTTELDGLPPPPAGVSASSAKTKGMDNYKQGQYADAIKWLSWAEVLLEKTGEAAGSMEVLSCRASCYKEVGEYKKAVADCTKVLDQDGENVAVLVQRALLYESMEKYRLGADDLRTVMKLDPGNRVARSTIHRLNKMAN